jgi:hypothetical protein
LRVEKSGSHFFKFLKKTITPRKEGVKKEGVVEKDYTFDIFVTPSSEVKELRG